MKTGCSTYQSQIPKGLMGELNPSDQQALESHIEECSVCSRERELYAETVRQLSSAGDVPVPRHFFVYSEEPPASRWQALPRLLLSWRTAAIAAGLAAVVLALAPMQVRSERGAFVVSFGRPAVTAQPLASPEAVDVAKLKAETPEHCRGKVSGRQTGSDSYYAGRTRVVKRRIHPKTTRSPGGGPLGCRNPPQRAARRYCDLA